MLRPWEEAPRAREMLLSLRSKAVVAEEPAAAGVMVSAIEPPLLMVTEMPEMDRAAEEVEGGVRVAAHVLFDLV